MTAFGRTRLEEAGYSVMVEVRALNGRGLDVVLRLPKNFLEFEEPLRKQVAKSLRRGRIEVFFQIETTDVERRAPHINLALARFYWGQLQELHRLLPGAGPPQLKDLLSIPHLFESREAVGDREVLKALLTRALSECLEQIQQMRIQEGEALLQDFLERLNHLHQDLTFIHSRRGVILEEYKQRLRERIQELLGGTEVDENRLLQEVACMAERSDINEETVRLGSHLDQVQGLLTAKEAADGRRLDFLAQELHREVNTIGCKTGDLEIVQAIVRMKSEIGKLKEQVQNVE